MFRPVSFLSRAATVRLQLRRGGRMGAPRPASSGRGGGEPARRGTALGRQPASTRCMRSSSGDLKVAQRAREFTGPATSRGLPDSPALGGMTPSSACKAAASALRPSRGSGALHGPAPLVSKHGRQKGGFFQSYQLPQYPTTQFSPPESPSATMLRLAASTLLKPSCLAPAACQAGLHTAATLQVG